MSLELKYGGQLLVAGNTLVNFHPGIDIEFHSATERFTATTANGESFAIRSIGAKVPRQWEAGTESRAIFAIQLSALPIECAAALREDANFIQKQIHDASPEFHYPRRGGLRPDNGFGRRRKQQTPVRPRPPVRLQRPPESIELPDTHVVRVVAHGMHDGRPYLEIGRDLEVCGIEPYAVYADTRTVTLGAITAFEITN